MPEQQRIRVEPEFSVAAHVDGNRLVAEAKFSEPQTSTSKMAFYLVRDTEVVWRGRYSEHPRALFRLLEPGQYSVKAFREVDGVKSSKFSNTVIFYGESGNSSDQLSASWPSSLPYTKLDYPHQDFSVVSRSGGLKNTMDALRSLALDFDLTASRWTTAAEEYGVVRSQVFRNDDEKFIFSGMAKAADRLVFGQEEIACRDKVEVAENVGDFVTVSVEDSYLAIETDYFGVGKVYYYSDGQIACASNRYHLLLLTLNALGVQLSVDRIKARSTLQAVNQPFTQNFTRRMDIENCYMMPIDQSLTMSNGLIELRDSEIRQVFDGPTDLDPNDVDYHKGVADASEEIVSNLRVALEHPRFESVRVDLTGGMDARLVFAALSHLGEYQEKIGVHTADVPSSPSDLKISLALTRNQPFGYNVVPRTVYDQSSKGSLLQIQSMNLGSYYGLRPESIRAHLKKAIRVNGFYGEISARPYFARLLFGTPLEDAHAGDFASRYVKSFGNLYRPLTDASELVSLFREEFERLPGGSSAAKMDAFYLFYRNGLHCSDRWLNHSLAPGWGPLQSKALFSVKWSTFMYTRNIQLQMDVTSRLNRELALIPIGRDKDNDDRSRIDSAYPSSNAVLEDELGINDRDLERYRDAARIRASKSLRQDLPTRHVTLTDNSRFDDERTALIESAITSLERDHSVVSPSEANLMRRYFADEYASGRSAMSQRSLVLMNKIISLYYQFQIVGRERV